MKRYLTFDEFRLSSIVLGVDVLRAPPMSMRFALIGAVGALLWSAPLFSLEYDKCPNTWVSKSPRVELANLILLGGASKKRGVAPQSTILVEIIDVRDQLSRFSVRGSSPKFAFSDIGKCGRLWYDYDLSDYYFAEIFPDLVCGGRKASGAVRIHDFLVGLDGRFEFERIEFLFNQEKPRVNIKTRQGGEKAFVIEECSL